MCLTKTEKKSVVETGYKGMKDVKTIALLKFV